MYAPLDGFKRWRAAGGLTEWVLPELVDEVLAGCGVRDQRPGALPARFMVYYVLGLALFQCLCVRLDEAIKADELDVSLELLKLLG